MRFQAQLVQPVRDGLPDTMHRGHHQLIEPGRPRRGDFAHRQVHHRLTGDFLDVPTLDELFQRHVEAGRVTAGEFDRQQLVRLPHLPTRHRRPFDGHAQPQTFLQESNRLSAPDRRQLRRVPLEDDPGPVFLRQPHQRQGFGDVEQTRLIHVNIGSPELRSEGRILRAGQEVIDRVRLPEDRGHAALLLSLEPSGFRTHHPARLFAVGSGQEHLPVRRQGFRPRAFPGRRFCPRPPPAHVQKLIGGGRHVLVNPPELPQPGFRLFARQLLAARRGIAQHPLDVLWRAEQRGRGAVRRAVHQRWMHVPQTRSRPPRAAPFLCDDGVSRHQLVPRPAPARLDAFTGHKEPVAGTNRRRHFFVGQFAGSQSARLPRRKLSSRTTLSVAKTFALACSKTRLSSARRASTARCSSTESARGSVSRPTPKTASTRSTRDTRGSSGGAGAGRHLDREARRRQARGHVFTQRFAGDLFLRGARQQNRLRIQRVPWTVGPVFRADVRQGHPQLARVQIGAAAHVADATRRRLELRDRVALPQQLFGRGDLPRPGGEKVRHFPRDFPERKAVRRDLDRVAEASATPRQVVVHPRIEGFAHPHHFPVVQGEIGFALGSSRDVGNQAVHVEVRIVRAAGFVREKSDPQVARGTRGFRGDECSPPVPDPRELFKPGELVFDRREQFRLEPGIDRRRHRESLWARCT